MQNSHDIQAELCGVKWYIGLATPYGRPLGLYLHETAREGGSAEVINQSYRDGQVVKQIIRITYPVSTANM